MQGCPPAPPCQLPLCMTGPAGGICGDQNQQGSCHHVLRPQSPDLLPPHAPRCKEPLCGAKAAGHLEGVVASDAGLAYYRRAVGRRGKWRWLVHHILSCSRASCTGCPLPFNGNSTCQAALAAAAAAHPLFSACVGWRCLHREAAALRMVHYYHRKTKSQIFVCYKCNIKIKCCLTRLHYGLG